MSKENNEISNEELENVIGGCDSNTPVPKYHLHQRLRRTVGYQYIFLTITKVGEYDPNERSFYYEFVYDGHDDVQSAYLDNKKDLTASKGTVSIDR